MATISGAVVLVRRLLAEVCIRLEGALNDAIKMT